MLAKQTWKLFVALGVLVGLVVGIWQMYLWLHSASIPDEFVIGCTDALCIRDKNRVRELLDSESTLSGGTYGFAVPWSIDDKQPSLSVTKRRAGTSKVEVHKTSAGTIFVVVYLNEDVAALLTDQRSERKIIHARFEKGDCYDEVVGLPQSRIMRWKNSSTTEGKGFAVIDVI